MHRDSLPVVVPPVSAEARALADLCAGLSVGKPIPLATRVIFNDDDWYVYDIQTLRVIHQLGPRIRPEPRPGQAVTRGMTARMDGLALWFEQSAIPRFLAQEVM